MRRGPRFKPSLAETKRQNNAAMTFYAKLADKPALLQPVPEKRAYTHRTDIITEADVSREITKAAARFDSVKLWRNNRGQVMTDNGGRITYGVGPNGASDFIGYRVLKITPEMVGSTVAQFVAVEAKRPGAKARDDQLEFIEQVNGDGGRAGVAMSGEDAVRILRR